MRYLEIFRTAVVIAVACYAFGSGAAAVNAQDEIPPEGEAAEAAIAAPDGAEQSGEPVDAETRKRLLEERLKRWQSLPAEKRRELLDRYKAFQKLPDEERNRIRMRLGQWNRMPLEQRQRFREQLRHYRDMPRERHARLRQRLQTWRAMTEERRELTRKVLEVLKSLPPEEVERLKGLSPAERREELARMLAEKGIDLSIVLEAGDGPPGGGFEGHPQGGPRRPRDGRGRGGGMRERQHRWQQDEDED